LFSKPVVDPFRAKQIKSESGEIINYKGVACLSSFSPPEQFRSCKYGREIYNVFMWTVKLSKQAVNFMKGLPDKNLHQIENGLSELSSDPKTGKPLKGELKGYWSFRVGIYRIIYLIKFHEIVVEVLRIQHRRDVYEKLRRL
jgi:mRNA interferase RelE/StbE